MQKITRKIAGQEWVINVNNSGWVAPENAPELFEVLKTLPVTGYTSKGVPIAKDDAGCNLYLGAAACRSESLGNHALAGGSGTKSKIPEAILNEILNSKLFGSLSKETQDFLNAQKPVDQHLAQVAKMLGKKVEDLTDDEIAKIRALGL